jgi:gamma-glutamyltranspeptidase/glutathione hydrolase
MCATGNPLAAQAGLEIMQKGGNAIDAALSMAMCLPVMEPTANGMGGDVFAIIYSKGKLYGLNASGWAPKNLSLKSLEEKGLKEIPVYGFEAVTVPGQPAAWASLSGRFGNLPLTEVAGPAVNFAKNGFPVQAAVANAWRKGMSNYKANADDEAHKHVFDTFTRNGETPKAGEIWKYKHMGDNIMEIAETKSESFYKGALMEKIVKFSDKVGGYFDKSDFTEFNPLWVDPVSTNYRGYDVFEIPPNGSGMTALMALNILENFTLDSERETARNYHLQLEAMKLAYADAVEYLADPNFMNMSIEALLSKDYARERAKLINMDRAGLYTFGQPKGSGTVYLCAADGEGNMISYIQSNYMGFGSGIVVEGTDIGLHNRGHNFSITEGHANCLAPRKRPYNTIIPGFLMKDGKAVGPFGVMGGFMQPQGHMQMMVNTIDFGMNPQNSLDAPRWRWIKGKASELEWFTQNDIVNKLASMGHEISVNYTGGVVGRGEIIWRMENGVLVGGTEPRTDGMIAAF